MRRNVRIAPRGRRQPNPSFGIEPQKLKPLPDEANDWWWNPGRPTVPRGPDWFQRRLDELDDTLAITENRYTGNYQIWSKKDSLRNPICTGWVLLFLVHPLELDNRVIKRLIDASDRKHGSGKAYWQAIEDQMRREKETADRAQRDDTLARATEFYDYTQVKNIGSGSKFSKWHS